MDYIISIVAFIATILFVTHNENGKNEQLYNVSLSVASIIVYEGVKWILIYFTR